ncbi:MAG: DNA primase [Candidatus Pacebacteria bacterium]|nr:DNA primase [Candidatus Paceibacterota bacterium]MDD2796407.1 DNA primase [Candidatus Paceibacterota bacterium]MDD3048059.1 DNA primase [Candidatus Paceibacterota bacterium]MDD3509812.1 DNA primase [Candidatus Paceibacterota bacterium]MDD3918424.1 DNA primase [Candidatus Paceibacterota bacterium]
MNDLEEIKNRLDIVDVISGYIKLEKAGANYKANCPFHDEKTPSFMVSPSKQIWHCFGCAQGGDIFEFVKRIEGVEFYDALKILAEKAGVKLKSYNKSNLKDRTERQKIAEVLEQALKFFEYYIHNSKKGTQTKEYLAKRGFSEELIKEWRIGYAPDSFDKLSKFLESRGYNKMIIEKAGLSFLKVNQELCDRFRSRIIFPFFGINSELIGFTGRIFEKDDFAKYLNTPSTILYDKSRALFGIDKAKVEIRKKDQCILVEGNVDCILAHSAGTKNVIAVSGTALTDMHLRIIKRYTLNLVFAFDMDSAGAKATERAIDLARSMEFNVSVLDLGKEKDPADVILKQGKDSWIKIVDKAEDIMDFYFRKAFLGKDINNVFDKKKIAEELLPQIKKLNNSIEQAHFIQKLARKLMVREEDLRKEFSKVRVDKVEKKEIIEIKDNLSQKEKIEKKFLKLYLINKIDVKEILYLFSPKYRDILEKIAKGEEIEDKGFLSEMFFGADKEKQLLRENEVTASEEIKNCIKNLKRIFLEEKKKNLSLKIKNEKDPKVIERLMEEYLNLIK